MSFLISWDLLGLVAMAMLLAFGCGRLVGSPDEEKHD